MSGRRRVPEPVGASPLQTPPARGNSTPGGGGRYRYCGLTLAADRLLPELPAAAADAVPDLEIVSGAVPEALPGEVHRTATFAHDGRAALWWLDGIGRFEVVAGGRRITVEPAPGADDASLRLMLLHPVMALASVLRGDWLLDAAAVERDGRVYALIGPSASGKSAAAGLLLRRGFRLVSDSLLRLTRDEAGRFLAHPQAPWLRLWPDAIRHLGLESVEQTPVRPGLALRRLTVPASARPWPLARIGLLREQRGNDLGEFALGPRPGASGVELLLQQIAGNTWLDDLADRRRLFHWAVALAARTPIERLEVPWGWERLERLAEQLAAWAGP